nr:hypothetical protein [Escherichia coli]
MRDRNSLTVCCPQKLTGRDEKDIRISESGDNGSLPPVSKTGYYSKLLEGNKSENLQVYDLIS